jgi:anti-sigma regulatory factor (Ser/Thr protein kinase)
MSPSDTRKITLSISNSIAELQKVVEFVENFGSTHNIPKGLTDDLNLCLDEILNNIVSYAYEDQSRHFILVGLSLEDDWLIAEVSDDGKPFNPWMPGPEPIEGTLRSRRIGGLGRSFVKALMDEVDYQRTSQYNVLTIKKRVVEV